MVYQHVESVKQNVSIGPRVLQRVERCSTALVDGDDFPVNQRIGR